MQLLRIFTVFMVAACQASSVYAQQSDQQSESKHLKKMYNLQGYEYHKSGEYRKSADSFRKAYAVDRDYKILLNIGHAEMSAERFGITLELYQQYMKEAGNNVPEKRKHQIAKEIKGLKGLVGTLNIKTDAECAVLVDNLLRSNTRIQKEFFITAEAEHVLEVRCGEQVVLSRKISVEKREYISVSLEWEPEISTKESNELEPEISPPPAPFEETMAKSPPGSSSSRLSSEQILGWRASEYLISSLTNIALGGFSLGVGVSLMKSNDAIYQELGTGLIFVGTVPFCFAILNFVQFGYQTKLKKLFHKNAWSNREETWLREKAYKYRFVSSIVLASAGAALASTGPLWILYGKGAATSFGNPLIIAGGIMVLEAAVMVIVDGFHLVAESKRNRVNVSISPVISPASMGFKGTF